MPVNICHNIRTERLKFELKINISFYSKTMLR
jgi:hypothetical protein